MSHRYAIMIDDDVPLPSDLYVHDVAASKGVACPLLTCITYIL